MSTHIIAIINQKGGVGKTTTAVNLAAAMSELEQKVLLIDSDPQGNASTALGVTRSQRQYSLYNILVELLPMAEAICATDIANLSIVPAHVDLAAAEIEIGHMQGRNRRLQQAVNLIEADFDYIFIDCPPTLNVLTVNALAAAHSAIVPLQCEFFALEGLSQLLKTVEDVKASLNPRLIIDGVVLTMYDSRNRLAHDVAIDVRKNLGNAVFRTLIPRNVRIAEAPSHGMPINAYDSMCAGARAYKALAEEVFLKHESHINQ